MAIETVTFEAGTLVVGSDVVLTLARDQGETFWAAAVACGAVSWSARRAVFPRAKRARVMDLCRTHLGAPIDGDDLAHTTRPAPTLVVGRASLAALADAGGGELRGAQARLRRLEETRSQALVVLADLDARIERARDVVAQLAGQS